MANRNRAKKGRPSGTRRGWANPRRTRSNHNRRSWRRSPPLRPREDERQNQPACREGDGPAKARRFGRLAVCIAGANVNAYRLLAATLEAIEVERPEPCPAHPQHRCLTNRCLTKGYGNPPTRVVVSVRGYWEHMRRTGEEKVEEETGGKTQRARRWVVARTFSWLSSTNAPRFRALAGLADAVGQEARKLPDQPQDGECASMVPQDMGEEKAREKPF